MLKMLDFGSCSVRDLRMSYTCSRGSILASSRCACRWFTRPEGRMKHFRIYAVICLLTFQSSATHRSVVGEEMNSSGISSAGAVKAEQIGNSKETEEDVKAIAMPHRTEKELLEGLAEENAIDQHAVHPSKQPLVTLEDIEYVVQEIDDAQNFVEAIGLENWRTIVQASSFARSAGSTRNLESPSQRDIGVQTMVLEAKFIEILLERTRKELALYIKHDDSVALVRCIQALSAVLRGFPLAQQRFVQAGGVDLFHEILRTDQMEPNGTRDKVLEIKNVLLMERELNLAEPSSASSRSRTDLERAREQYDPADLEGSLRRSGWCSTLMELCEAGSDSEGYDPTTLVTNIRLLGTTCSEEFALKRKAMQKLCEYFVWIRKWFNARMRDDLIGDRYATAAHACDQLPLELFKYGEGEHEADIVAGLYEHTLDDL